MKKLHAGHVPMTGVKSKFMKSEGKTFLYLTIGVDIQKQFKIKKGNRLLLTYAKDNPFKILVEKTKDKDFGSYSVMQPDSSRSVHICPTWPHKKPKVVYYKKGHPAKIKIRKNGFLIELPH